MAKTLPPSYSPRTSLAKIAARKLEYIRSKQRPLADQERTAEKEQTLAWHLETCERFCELLEIIDKSGTRRRLSLNEVQRLYLAAATPRDIVLKSRQATMSTVLLARDVYRFLTVRGARVVVVCQSMTGNGPITTLSTVVRRYFDSLRSAGMRLNFSTEKSCEWAIEEFDSSLRIIVAGASELSADKVGRSGTITHLHCTETAFWEFGEKTANALFECVPGVSHGSEIVIESTANGASGLFFRLCRAAQAKTGSFKFHFYPWYLTTEYSSPLVEGERIEPGNGPDASVETREREQHLIAKGVTPEQLKWHREKVSDKGRRATDQEYPGDPETCFLIEGRSFFDEARTAHLLSVAPQPIQRRDRDRVLIWKAPEQGKRYLLSADTAEGGGGDPSGAVLRERDTGIHCATIIGQYTPWDLAEALNTLGLEYNTAEIAVERNNHGHAVIQALEKHHRYPKIYKHDDGKFGWPTNAVTRPTMLDALEDAHRHGHWGTNCRATLEQFRTFVISASGKAEAIPGDHDDLVMAEAIGWAVRQRPVRTYDGIGRAKSGWT